MHVIITRLLPITQVQKSSWYIMTYISWCHLANMKKTLACPNDYCLTFPLQGTTTNSHINLTSPETRVPGLHFTTNIICLCICILFSERQNIQVQLIPVWKQNLMYNGQCRRQYIHQRHCQFSAVHWKLNFLPRLTAALWLMNISLHWLLRDPTITVMCPCSPRTYATLK